MRSWRLVDADPIARDHKYTFYKPSRELISKVQVGELVKLIFAFDSDDPAAPRAERMWVRITRIDRGEAFVGELESEPIYITDLQCGDSLEFSPCHIINTERDDPNNIVERFARRCFVTRRVLDEGYPVGYLYREKPDRADDSGWRLLAGDESDEYMADPKNCAYVSLGAVLSRDESFVGLLESQTGLAFARSADTGEFIAVSKGS